MIHQVELPRTTPSTTDCLAWSDDGELAIATGQEVYILVKHKSP